MNGINKGILLLKDMDKENEQSTESTSVSRGQTFLWLVVGVIAYVGIQWAMPKVGLNS